MNYIEYLLILVSTFIGCVSVSVFCSVVGISVKITSSPVGLRTYVINARIKKCKIYYI